MGKTNPADMLSRRPDYKGQEELNIELLPLLQAKMPRATPDERSRQGEASEMPVTANVSTITKKWAKEVVSKEDAHAQGPSEGLLQQIQARMPRATLDKRSRQGEAGEMPVTANVFLIAKKWAREAVSKEDIYMQGTSEGLLQQVCYLQKNNQEYRQVRANPKLGE